MIMKIDQIKFMNIINDLLCRMFVCMRMCVRVCRNESTFAVLESAKYWYQ